MTWELPLYKENRKTKGQRGIVEMLTLIHALFGPKDLGQSFVAFSRYFMVIMGKHKSGKIVVPAE